MMLPSNPFGVSSTQIGCSSWDDRSATSNGAIHRDTPWSDLLQYDGGITNAHLETSYEQIRETLHSTIQDAFGSTVGGYEGVVPACLTQTKYTAEKFTPEADSGSLCPFAALLWSWNQFGSEREFDQSIPEECREWDESSRIAVKSVERDSIVDDVTAWMIDKLAESIETHDFVSEVGSNLGGLDGGLLAYRFEPLDFSEFRGLTNHLSSEESVTGSAWIPKEAEGSTCLIDTSRFGYEFGQLSQDFLTCPDRGSKTCQNCVTGDQC
jgi:hypothetical protein